MSFPPLPFDFQHLATTADADERDAVPPEAFIEATKAFAQTMLSQLDSELYAVTVEARKLADAYWRFNKDYQEDGGKENQGYFGTRARLIGRTLSLEWYIKTIYTPPSDPSGKKQVRSTYLSRGKGFTYPKTAFRRAKDWELEAIQEIEASYATLRQRAQTLTKMRRSLQEYLRLSLPNNDLLSQSEGIDDEPTKEQ